MKNFIPSWVALLPLETQNFIMTPSVTTLFDLPTELHLEMIQFLDYNSKLALSQTCSFFTAMITTKATTLSEGLIYIYEAEKWTR
jgi:hypothetical protein